MASDASHQAAGEVDMTMEPDNGTATDSELDMNITDTEAKFNKACHQLILLNNYIESIQVRYDRAQQTANRTARYNYRIKLCVVEGVRNMFYEYAVRLADDIDDMRRQLGMIVVRAESDDAMSTASENEEYGEGWDEPGYSAGEEAAGGAPTDSAMDDSPIADLGEAPPALGTITPGDLCD